jgi:hypothetical protein
MGVPAGKQAVRSACGHDQREGGGEAGPPPAVVPDKEVEADRRGRDEQQDGRPGVALDRDAEQ